jgi:eukaryotic-like serine/threonine-protein kinase
MHERPVDGATENVLLAGRYRVQEVIDRGGTGIVRRAVDEALGHSVVLEQLTSDAVAAARIAATVQHPHLVSILDVVEEPDALWLVCEDVPARSLAQLVSDYGRMSAAAAADIGAQIASGLAAVHAAGTAHGGLAPESILVADTGTGPFAKISGLGISPAADAATDVHSLGAALSAAVGGRAPETLAPLLRQLTTDDPAARPTAAQAHVELARLATALAGPADPHLGAPLIDPKGPPPRRRQLRVLRAAAAGTALLIALVVAVSATTVAPAPQPVASVPPINPADERTLDPCSLIDVAALAQIGPATIRPGYGVFSECVAVIPVGTDDIHVEVELRNGDTAGHVDAQRDPLNPVAVPGSQGDDFCSRDVLLPDGHVVSVSAVMYGYTYRSDYCAMAGIAADAVIARLIGGGLTSRTSDADRSALDDIKACDLLEQESVTAAVAAAGGPPAQGPTNGYAGWYCDWAPVWLDYMREAAPGAPEFYGDPVTIGGRPGLTRTDGGDGHCRAYVPQRVFTAADGAMRAEYVRVIVEGTAETATICRAAIDLAERVATRLPAFG